MEPTIVTNEPQILSQPVSRQNPDKSRLFFVSVLTLGTQKNDYGSSFLPLVAALIGWPIVIGLLVRARTHSRPNGVKWGFITLGLLLGTFYVINKIATYQGTHPKKPTTV